MKTKTSALEPLIAELDSIIAAAAAAHLTETAALLRIARLDLMMRAHGIGAGELELLTFALTRGICETGAAGKPKAKRAPKTKPRNN